MTLARRRSEAIAELQNGTYGSVVTTISLLGNDEQRRQTTLCNQFFPRDFDVEVLDRAEAPYREFKNLPAPLIALHNLLLIDPASTPFIASLHRQSV